MAATLFDEIADLRQRVPPVPAGADADWAGTCRAAGELSAAAFELYLRIEADAASRQPPPPAWDETLARREIPLFTAWHEAATPIRDLRTACRERGHRAENGEEFLHAYNRSKIMAVDFESLVESNRRFEAGERRGVPLQQVLNGLRRRA